MKGPNYFKLLNYLRKFFMERKFKNKIFKIKLN